MSSARASNGRRIGMRRVAVTGMGILSPVGNRPADVTAALRESRSGIRFVNEWSEIADLRPKVAGTVDGVDATTIPRSLRRSMGRGAVLSTLAARAAVADAGLDPETIHAGEMGIALGSTTGSPEAIGHFYSTVANEGVRGLRATDFLKCMSHTFAANVALALGSTGRVLAPSAACTSGSQAIGTAFELIACGLEGIMLAGGADEIHYTTAATFDVVGAASYGYNDSPTRTPRPFDADRDGLAVAEGAGLVVLESWDRAVARGATIHAEVLAFANTSDGRHMAQPAEEGMRGCIQRALRNAGLGPTDIDYVNAHATGTELGDIAEAGATRGVFGDAVPVSSTKGITGHTLGACGSIETIFCIQMMGEGFLAPTRNLEQVDPRCAGLQHVTEARPARLKRVMNNNFAFGGINTSLILAAAP